ncbi:MAG: hypothetical protein LJE69_06970 [Thiohalocapsa sp.]|uniref:hypothetical protein n=1 Tax=Thiohalocapsa sp. TaxID=2497641 RepID=UPI0025E29575|nr:hypothetical protein [Thiohalocapsa sp.]MCG6940976.1 hypothetical protein [Thiohalocapsa sp.]
MSRTTTSTAAEVIARLPEPVGAALEAALELFPGGRNARITNPANEGALNHVLLIRTEQAQAVFRMRRAASSREIFDYLNAMYVHTGFPELGGLFRLRSIGEEIAFLHQARALGLPVPALLAEGDDWMLIELIEGRTAYAAVKDGDLGAVAAVVDTLRQAHERGVIYGDRWGDNEVIDPSGRVRPIDFDVEWTLREHRPGFLEAMEMGVYLFNALRLTSERPALLDLARRDLAPRLRDRGYDMPRMAGVVAGLGRFYLDPDKPGNEWSLPASLYRDLAAPVATLAAELNS